MQDKEFAVKEKLEIVKVQDFGSEFLARPSPPAGGEREIPPKKFDASPRSLKTAKEPEKYRLEPHFVKENFIHLEVKTSFLILPQALTSLIIYAIIMVWKESRILSNAP